ncbi:hypothetical protein VTO42DRAFT_3181 [Malbranchea cinnamomea]
MIKVTCPQFEHLPSPVLGIGESSPRISWGFADATEQQTNWVQESYEIEITRDDGTSKPEIFRVQSPESRLVPWPSKPLISRERAKVRVRATGRGCNAPTEWSDVAIVEAGLLKRDDWASTKLIQPATPAYVPGPPHRPVVMRCSFEIEKPIRSARLYMTAQGLYDAKINGRRVGDQVLTPGWTSYKHRIVYQTYDVTGQLESGRSNSVEVELGAGWYVGRLGWKGGRSNSYGDSLGLIGLLVAELEDGKTIVKSTDDSWKWTYSPILEAELYDGEKYDARLELSAANPSWNPVKSLDLPHNLVAPIAPPVKQTQTLRPRKILKSPSGKTVVDFGQNFVGWVRLRVKGPSGTTIHLQHAEVLEDGEVATRPLRDAKARDTVILSDQELIWEPKFTFHGFRYVEVTGFPGELTLDNIEGIVVGTDMKRTGYFACSNPLLNRLHENVVWSTRSNFLSLPTDCPQRDERFGWTGDINMFADTANYLFDTAGLLSSWLMDLAAEQNEGIVPLVVPNVVEGFDQEAHAVWGDVAVMLPWSIYQAFGDKQVLARQYTSMQSWLKAIPRNQQNLWNYTAEWKLGDWLDPAAPPEDPGNATTDPNLVSDAFLVHITRLMGMISAELGKEEDSVHYVDAAKQLANAFVNEYVTPSGRLAADTQTGLALAIAFSLFSTEAQEKHAADRLTELILRNSRFKIATGFAGTPFIGHALSKTGHHNLFYRMLLHRKNPSWLYPVTMGATTIWERWDSMLPNGKVNPGEMTSFNHYALGSVACWMHRNIAGLRPLEPGWRTFAIEPVPGGGLKWAEGKFVSSYGECYVKWEIRSDRPSGDDGTLVVRVTAQVPPNTSAKVKLPGSNSILTVGSGSYQWEVPFTPQTWPPRALYPPELPRDDELPDDEAIPST